MSHENLASVTDEEERWGHIQAAREAWLSMGLPEQAERVAQRFG